MRVRRKLAITASVGAVAGGLGGLTGLSAPAVAGSAAQQAMGIGTVNGALFVPELAAASGG